METFELSFYAVSLIAGPSEYDDEAARPAATIHATTAGGKDDKVGIYLRFYRPGVLLPRNQRIANDDGSRLYMVSYRYDQLAGAVDLLRNERPMYFKYDKRSSSGYLSTSEEPVGEGEVLSQLLAEDLRERGERGSQPPPSSRVPRDEG